MACPDAAAKAAPICVFSSVVEHRLDMAVVAGSIPARRTILYLEHGGTVQAADNR